MCDERKTGEGQKVKVMYFIGTLGRGGAEGQLLALIERIDKSRFCPSLVLLKEEGDYYSRCVELGIPLYSLKFAGLTGSLYPWNLWRIMKSSFHLYSLMRKEKPHIVHGYLFVSYIIAALLGKLAGVPLIISSRRSLGSSKTRLWTPLHRLAEMLANSWTDCVIANSDAVKNDTVTREKLDRSMVITIHNGVDCERFKVQANPVQIKKELGIREGQSVVGMIANLIHYKNHKLLISAIPEIMRRVPDVHFLLIGRDGGMEKELRRLAGSLGVDESITFTGPRSDISSILSILDISVLTSNEEGFPNALLESMASGVPVVATNVGGVPEAVEDGVTGFLVPSGDKGALAGKIVEILSDERCSTAMRRNARARVNERFSMEKMVKATEDVYWERLKIR